MEKAQFTAIQNAAIHTAMFRLPMAITEQSDLEEVHQLVTAGILNIEANIIGLGDARMSAVPAILVCTLTSEGTDAAIDIAVTSEVSSVEYQHNVSKAAWADAISVAAETHDISTEPMSRTVVKVVANVANLLVAGAIAVAAIMAAADLIIKHYH